jgi:hypothetical protein
MFKRQHNESPYDKSVTFTEMVFAKRTVPRELLVKKCLREINENSTEGLVADVK